MIELAAGFHPDLTGAENVYLQGSIMGMKRREIDRRFDEIVDFAGLDQFMDMPVKRYSSGMNARLGFSIAAHLEVDVLLVDEVLAVGDFDFQQKAFGRLKEITTSGIPVVVVSHQLQRVSQLCSQAILLREGRVAARGTPAECIDAYVTQAPGDEEGAEGTRAIWIRGVDVRPGRVIDSGDRVELVMDIEQREPFPEDRVAIWFLVRSLQTGEVLYASSTHSLGVDVPLEGDFTTVGSLAMNVPPGSYSLECHVWDQVLMKHLHYGPPTLIQVKASDPFMGSVQMNATVTVTPA